MVQRPQGKKMDIYAVRIKDWDKLNLIKISNDSKVLGSSQFSLLPQLPHITTLALKVVKNDSKIVILILKSKSVTHSEDTFIEVHMSFFKTFITITLEAAFLFFVGKFLPQVCWEDI